MWLENACLDAHDGLVLHNETLWFHWQTFQWSLSAPASNPTSGEVYNRFSARLRDPLPTSPQAHLQGCFHLGIHPHIYSYYHLWTDLLPSVLQQRKARWLLPWWTPPNFVAFLQEIGARVLILSRRVVQLERLFVPPKPSPEQIRQTAEHLHGIYGRRRPLLEKAQKLYISRYKTGRRHLRNEAELRVELEQRGFRTVHLEDASVPQQISLFSQTTELVAPHGAGLTNVLFMPQASRVLEIRPAYGSGKFCFTELCAWRDHEHEVLVPPQGGEFRLEPRTLRERLRGWEAIRAS